MTKYFNTPNEWRKGISEVSKMNDLYGQISYHKSAINDVKKRLGRDCTFLSHLDSKGAVKFMAFLNLAGKSTRVTINTDKKSFDDLKAEDYKNLRDVLHERIKG